MPASFVLTVRETLVLTLVNVTVALGIGACTWSRTEPRTVLLPTCAQAAGAQRRDRTIVIVLVESNTVMPPISLDREDVTHPGYRSQGRILRCCALARRRVPVSSRERKIQW